MCHCIFLGKNPHVTLSHDSCDNGIASDSSLSDSQVDYFLLTSSGMCLLDVIDLSVWPGAWGDCLMVFRLFWCSFCPGQTSPEVQNRDISGLGKRTYVLQKNLKNKQTNKQIQFQQLRFENPHRSTCFHRMKHINYRSHHFHKKNLGQKAKNNQ